MEQLSSSIVEVRTSPRTNNVVHRPVFIGTEKPIFAVLSAPADRRVRAAVLVCPPLGKEQAETTRALRLAAARLAERRIAVLRIDYRHTGESWGSQTDPRAAEEWLRSVEVAVDHLRVLGAAHVGAIGLRAGALFLSQLPDTLSELDFTVFWDSVSKGRALVRSKSVLYNMVSEDNGVVPGPRPDRVDDEDPERVHVAGHSMHSTAAAALGVMVIDPKLIATQAPQRTLVMLRETDTAGRVGRAMADAGVEVVQTRAPDYFVEPTHPGYLEFPTVDLDLLTDWVDESCGTQLGSVDVPSTDDEVRAVIARTADGRGIETRVRSVPGTGELYWDTALEGRHETATQVMVSYSLGQYVRSGPSRLWWEAAEAVAAVGGRAIRFDRLGVGESGDPSVDDAEIALYAPEFVEGAAAILPVLDDLPPSSTVVHTGICVGAWVATHAAIRHAARHPETHSAVVMVNPLMWRLRPQRGDTASVDVGIGGLPEQFGEPTLVDKVIGKLSWHGNRAAPRIRRRLPARLHTAVGRLPFIQMPEVVFNGLARENVRAAMVFSPRDHAYFVSNFGGDDALRSNPEPIRRWVAPVGDHTAYHRFMRRALITSVLCELVPDGTVEVPEESVGPGGAPIDWRLDS